jgi:hypothetical protein
VRADPERDAYLTELVRVAQDDVGTRPALWEQDRYRAEVEHRLASWSHDAGVAWVAPVAEVAALVLSATDGVVRAWVVDRDDRRAETSVGLLARAVASLARPA